MNKKRLQEIYNTRDLFDGCLNRLSVTNDLNEFSRLCGFANSYLSKIMKLNYERLQEQESEKNFYSEFYTETDR